MYTLYIRILCHIHYILYNLLLKVFIFQTNSRVRVHRWTRKPIFFFGRFGISQTTINISIVIRHESNDTRSYAVNLYTFIPANKRHRTFARAVGERFVRHKSNCDPVQGRADTKFDNIVGNRAIWYIRTRAHNLYK